jgi:hypothetical protein
MVEIQLGELAELRRGTRSSTEAAIEEPPKMTGLNPSSSSSRTAPSGSGAPSGCGATTGSGATSGGGGGDWSREAEIRKLRDEFYCFFNRPMVMACVGENHASIYNMCRFVV